MFLYQVYFQGDRLISRLPKNIKILTLEPWKDEEILLRLEHLFEKDEDPKYSVPVIVDLEVKLI